jgi:hypothetical protein
VHLPEYQHRCDFSLLCTTSLFLGEEVACICVELAIMLSFAKRYGTDLGIWHSMCMEFGVCKIKFPNNQLRSLGPQAHISYKSHLLPGRQLHDVTVTK